MFQNVSEKVFQEMFNEMCQKVFRDVFQEVCPEVFQNVFEAKDFEDEYALMMNGCEQHRFPLQRSFVVGPLIVIS